SVRIVAEGGVAAGEDEAKPVVGQRLVRGVGRVTLRRREAFGDLLESGVEARATADAVDRLEAARGNQPGARILGYAIARPLLNGGGKGFGQRFFREVAVAEQPDPGLEDPARLVAVERIEVDQARGSPGAPSTGPPP